MWVVYIIQHSNTKQFYIGKTGNLKRRLREHNKNSQKSTCRKSGVWILAYAEAYRAKSDADMRELRLKNHGRAKQEVLKRAPQSFFRNQSGAGCNKSIPGDCLTKTQLPANS